MSFLSDYEVYASTIYYNNKKFTPKQLENYFEQTEKQNFADTNNIKKVTTISQKILKNIINKYELTIDQILQAKTSDSGKALAHLALLHCDVCHLLSGQPESLEELLKVYSSWENSL
ncbi:MAG: hypothetical protein Q8O03_06290 [Nanoarchaeota archaeon]|nr:hypothetical protein [Nanoarchaeota archaeon]